MMSSLVTGLFGTIIAMLSPVPVGVSNRGGHHLELDGKPPRPVPSLMFLLAGEQLCIRDSFNTHTVFCITETVIKTF